LLWLGGIGTYVKASSEKHEEVGDRSNDNVRVDACDLAAKVVGEGANLGFTQKARIEYSLRGGSINTDAVDNSAGVDTSDHEVNLKILLTNLHKKHVIDDYQSLFIEMTEAVCQLVLADNYAQSLCLSLDQRRCAENLAVFLQVAERVEAAGFLDKAVESFVHNKEIQSRPGQQLTRPELAVLMAASKMYLTQQIQNQAVQFQHECYNCYLHAYFPAQCSNPFNQHLASHPLANEIKATVISNKIINQAGIGFLSLADDSGRDATLDYVNCYLTYDQILQADALRQAICALDNQIPAELQYQLLLQLEQILAEFCRWTVLYGRTIRPEINTINSYSRYLKDYQDYLNLHASSHLQEQFSQYQHTQIPSELTRKLFFISNIQNFPFVVLLVTETERDFATILSLLNDITDTLGLNEVRQQLAKMTLRDYWERNVTTDLLADMERVTGQLLKKILLSQLKTCADYFELQIEKQRVKQYRRVYQEINSTQPGVLLPYVALIRALESLIEDK
jgi:glutamate dehydrogenase